MNKEQQELLDEAYRKYADSHQYFVNGWLHVIPMLHSNETFINECKTNTEFSEKWGLKIEERELSLEERSFIAGSNHNEVSQNIKGFTGIDEDHTLHKHLDDVNIPTKLITITYNNETIESYEN